MAHEKNRVFGILSMERPILFVSSISLLVAGYFGLFLSFYTWLGMFALALLSGIYAFPILPRRRNLRHLGLLKVLIIALVWAGATVALPVLEYQPVFRWDTAVEFLQRLLITGILMVPFEVRDLSIDPEDMLTLPQRFGIRRTKSIGLWLCLLCFVLTYLKDDLSAMEIAAKGGICLSLAGLLLFLPKEQPRFFASFWVEAFPIFWALLLWSSTNFG